MQGAACTRSSIHRCRGQHDGRTALGTEACRLHMQCRMNHDRTQERLDMREQHNAFSWRGRISIHGTLRRRDTNIGASWWKNRHRSHGMGNRPGRIYMDIQRRDKHSRVREMVQWIDAGNQGSRCCRGSRNEKQRVQDRHNEWNQREAAYSF